MILGRRGEGSAGRGARFLDPRVLQRIGNLELVARGVVEGFLHGIHRSPHVGHSLDFAEHRQYVPGDDPRRVDWRVLARTDRYYVKEFEAETNTNVMVLLDRSASMAFGHEGVSKLEYARFLAASLVYLARSQGDRVGLATLDEEARAVVPCSARHLERVLATLDGTDAHGAGALPEALDGFARQRRRPSILALISDLYVDPEELAAPVAVLTAAGNEVIVFQVLDPAERTFPYEEALTVEDMETGERVPVTPGELREEYRSLVEQHLGELERTLLRAGADHVVLDTARPLDGALAEYLTARQRRKRSGRWASRS